MVIVGSRLQTKHDFSGESLLLILGLMIHCQLMYYKLIPAVIRISDHLYCDFECWLVVSDRARSLGYLEVTPFAAKSAGRMS